MKPEHEPTHINTFNVGTNSDDGTEMVGSKPGSGEVIDSENGRPTDNEGNVLYHNKIRGEQLFFPTTDPNANLYECIGSDSINGDLIECWADTSGVNASLIRVNGVVVLQSILFDYRVQENFQFHKNENALGGQWFITNNRTPPMILDVQDMVTSLISAPAKYFAGFDPALYEINLAAPLDIPVFIELVNVGGGGGMPVGEYQYSIRYSSLAGDRTNWSVATPPIPVVQSLNNQSDIYPFVKTYGGPPDPAHKTALAIKIRFRVTNIFNYDFIEIRRTELNQGAGIGFTPESILIAKVSIGAGEISVRDYIDPVEANDNAVISANEDTQQIAFIKAAKGIRYYDTRLNLQNVELASKESALTFKQINGKEGFEVIENLFEPGYNDPYNHTYKKSYQRGEKCGFAVIPFDGVGGKGFAQKIPTLTNFYFPNRREPISADVAFYSYGGTVKATDINNNVVQTHEVFEHYGDRRKTDVCSFKNIVRNGQVTGLTGTKLTATVKQDCDENDGEIENHGARVNGGAVSVSYQPFTPVRANDPDVTGHNYIVNSWVSINGSESDPDAHEYRPPGFALNVYGQGLAVAGVDNFYPWMKAFSIVRRDIANRVIAQGLGTYKMFQADYSFLTNKSLATKEKNKLWFFSPDIENGVVSSDVVNDIIENPQNYKIQLVSPLGFFSEVYSFEDKLLSERDRLVDMITYARMLRDVDGGAINPGEDPNMGFGGGDGNRYPGFAKYRNTGQTPPTFSGSDGNKIFSIAQVKRVAEGRGTYVEIEFTQDIYGTDSTGGTFHNNFEDSGMKDWTEPLYVVNIIADGANVPNQNIEAYKQTGHYQKLESIIGKGTGLTGQKYMLVDERWEDSIPHYNPAHPLAAEPRYIYIKHPDNTEEKWLNVTFLTVANIALIDATIISSGSYTGPFGVGVQGMYTHEVVDSSGYPVGPSDPKNRFFQVVFNVLTYIPGVDDRIIIKYDNTATTRVFGGDTVIGESIHAVIDKESDAKDNEAETQFAFGIGFPYRHWKMNPRYYTVRKAGGALNVIQDKEWFFLGFLRQLCYMFTVESKISMPYSYNAAYPLQFFPLINYVIRPNRWDESKSIYDNGIFQDYVDDYGESEKDRWKFGGFRFLQQVNPDFSNEPPKEFFSKPAFGFIEQTRFYTRNMWSLPRAINVQNSPGNRTFPANNSFDISDDQGEIKRAYSASTSRGTNLYAITNKGICLLVTGKSILSDLNAGEIAYMAADSFIREQYWITKKLGMTDEMWRSSAEAFIPMVSQDGAEIRMEGLFFANYESVFRFIDNNVEDIGRIKYYNRIYNDGLNKVSLGFSAQVAGVFDNFNQEYWLYMKNAGPRKLDIMFAFSQRTNRWTGTFDYKFDKFTASGTKMYGHRKLTTYQIGVGNQISGANINYTVTACAAPEQYNDKEFIRIRINTQDETQKPTRVEFFKQKNGPVQCFLDPSQGALYLKNYRGFENFIPRIDASVNANRPRFQQRQIIFKIFHNGSGEFHLIDTGILYKNIK